MDDPNKADDKGGGASPPSQLPPVPKPRHRFHTNANVSADGGVVSHPPSQINASRQSSSENPVSTKISASLVESPGLESNSTVVNERSTLPPRLKLSFAERLRKLRNGDLINDPTTTDVNIGSIAPLHVEQIGNLSSFKPEVEEGDIDEKRSHVQKSCAGGVVSHCPLSLVDTSKSSSLENPVGTNFSDTVVESPIRESKSTIVTERSTLPPRRKFSFLTSFRDIRNRGLMNDPTTTDANVSSIDPSHVQESQHLSSDRPEVGEDAIDEKRSHVQKSAVGGVVSLCRPSPVQMESPGRESNSTIVNQRSTLPPRPRLSFAERLRKLRNGDLTNDPSTTDANAGLSAPSHVEQIRSLSSSRPQVGADAVDEQPSQVQKSCAGGVVSNCPPSLVDTSKSSSLENPIDTKFSDTVVESSIVESKSTIVTERSTLPPRRKFSFLTTFRDLRNRDLINESSTTDANVGSIDPSHVKEAQHLSSDRPEVGEDAIDEKRSHVQESAAGSVVSPCPPSPLKTPKKSSLENPAGTNSSTLPPRPRLSFADRLRKLRNGDLTNDPSTTDVNAGLSAPSHVEQIRSLSSNRPEVGAGAVDEQPSQVQMSVDDKISHRDTSPSNKNKPLTLEKPVEHFVGQMELPVVSPLIMENEPAAMGPPRTKPSSANRFREILIRNATKNASSSALNASHDKRELSSLTPDVGESAILKKQLYEQMVNSDGGVSLSGTSSINATEPPMSEKPVDPKFAVSHLKNEHTTMLPPRAKFSFMETIRKVGNHEAVYDGCNTVTSDDFPPLSCSDDARRPLPLKTTSKSGSAGVQFGQFAVRDGPFSLPSKADGASSVVDMTDTTKQMERQRNDALEKPTAAKSDIRPSFLDKFLILSRGSKVVSAPRQSMSLLQARKTEPKSQGARGNPSTPTVSESPYANFARGERVGPEMHLRVGPNVRMITDGVPLRENPLDYTTNELHKLLNAWYYVPAMFNKTDYPFCCGGFVCPVPNNMITIFTRRLGPITLEEFPQRKSSTYMFFMVVGPNCYRVVVCN